MRPKTAWLYFGQLVRREIFFSIFFFFWTSKLHISQAFREHQACPILAPYEPVVKFCSKRVLSSFFLYFLRSSYMQPCGWNCLNRVLRKSFVLSIESWFFTFFHFFFLAHGSTWCDLQFDHCDSNVKFLIIFKKFYKVHSIEVLTQDPHQQKKILAHSYL